MAIKSFNRTVEAINDLLDKLDLLPETPMTYKGEVIDYADLPEEPQAGDCYLVSFETGTDHVANRLYYYSGVTWKEIAVDGYTKYEIDQMIGSLAGGVHWIGAVNYYNNLPSEPSLGDAYTVLYKGTSGTDADGSEYVWGTLSGTDQWILFGRDTYTKAEVDVLLTDIEDDIEALESAVSGKQDEIDSSHPIDATEVKLNTYAKTTGNIATNDTVKTALGKLETKADDNKTNILSLTANGGGINKATINDGSGTGSITIPCDAITGQIIIKIAEFTSTDTDSNTSVVQFVFNDDTTTGVIETGRGSNLRATVNVVKTIKSIKLYASDNSAHSTGDTFTFSGLEICSIDNDNLPYQPYAMSNAELTAELNPTAYTALTLSSSASGKIDIKSGGYCKVGNLVIINARIEVTTDIANNAYIFNGLPLPVAVNTATSGYSVCAITAIATTAGVSDTAVTLMLYNPTQPSGGTPTQGALYTIGNHSGLPVGTYLLTGSYLSV